MKQSTVFDGTIDKVLHQPIRTKIMTLLALHNQCEYLFIKNELKLSDGHMTTHIRELLAHEYITVEKLFVDNKPKTLYAITAKGKEALRIYLQQLQELVASCIRLVGL